MLRMILYCIDDLVLYYCVFAVDIVFLKIEKSNKYNLKSLIFTLTFKKFCTNLTQKVMSTSKTEMKNKYETKSSCAPFNNPGIKNVFYGYSRYTTI